MEPIENNISILIIEDEVLIAENIKIMLEDFGYKIADICYTYEAAQIAIQQADFDILVTDINLGNRIETKTGIQIVEQLKKIKSCPVIFLTAFSDKETVKKAATLSPSAYLVKPINPSSLYATLQIAFENYKNASGASIGATNSEKSDYFFIKQGDKMIKLLWADVYHLESIKNYVKIKTAQYQSGLLIRSSLQNLIDEMLPLSIKNRFVKINRSEAIEKSIVNMIGTGYVSTTFGEFRTSIDLKRDDFL